MLQKIKPQFALYTEAQLTPGAQRFGISIEQERLRLRILATPQKIWPQTLKAVIADRKRQFLGSDDIIRVIVEWLKVGAPRATA